MMITMEHTEKNDVLKFPIQKKNVEPLDGRELMQQVRLTAIKVLNMVAIGQVKELPENIKVELRIVNQGCLKYGLPLLEGDF